jgi:hypothetical protein
MGENNMEQRHEPVKPTCLSEAEVTTLLPTPISSVDDELLPETRKPFDLLVEGLFASSSRGDRTPVELFLKEAGSWGKWVADLP